MNIKKVFLPIFLSMGTVFAFVVSFKKNSIPIINSTSFDQKKIDKTASNPQNLQKLSVLPLKCIGCGKCVRIDSVHFEMSNNKAIVISSVNLNSQNLSIAINNCPVQAITLQ
jgi:ferredoxin